MNVTLCSAFRNSTPYLRRYFEQVARLGNLLDGHLHVIWCEGDSTDRTYNALVAVSSFGKAQGCYTTDVFQHSHGGPDHGSVVNAERFANMAKVWNEIWRRIPDDADAVVFVESDLIWEPATIIALLDDLAIVPAVAPKIILRREGYHPEFWYDNWGFWRNGVQIRTMPPYFAELTPDGDLLELDSAGSCLVMRGDVARRVSWPPEDVIRGVCRQIREGGDSVWLDAMQKVIHE